MSIYAQDPGDLTPEEMYDRQRVQRMSREEFEREVTRQESENFGDETVTPEPVKEAA